MRANSWAASTCTSTTSDLDQMMRRRCAHGLRRRVGAGRRGEAFRRRLDLRAHRAAVRALCRASVTSAASAARRARRYTSRRARPTSPAGRSARTRTAMSQSIRSWVSTSSCSARPRGAMRACRIEHCTLVTPDLVRRIKAAGVIPLPFAGYVLFPRGEDAFLRRGAPQAHVRDARFHRRRHQGSARIGLHREPGRTDVVAALGGHAHRCQRPRLGREPAHHRRGSDPLLDGERRVRLVRRRYQGDAGARPARRPRRLGPRPDDDRSDAASRACGPNARCSAVAGSTRRER